MISFVSKFLSWYSSNILSISLSFVILGILCLGVSLVGSIFTGLLQVFWSSVPVILYSGKFLTLIYLTSVPLLYLPFCSLMILIWFLFNSLHDDSLVCCLLSFFYFPFSTVSLAVSYFLSWNNLIFCSATIILIFIDIHNILIILEILLSIFVLPLILFIFIVVIFISTLTFPCASITTCATNF